MPDFVVHTVPGSPYARAVMAMLEEKNAAWHLAALTPGTLRQPPHRSRHPFGKVPVLEHDGFVLYETQAILRYLERALPTPSLTPSDPQAAARMDQVMNVNDCYLFQGCANVIVFHRVVGPRVMGIVPDEAAILDAMPRARVVLAELSRLLGDQPYFGGGSLSLADLLVAPHLDMFSVAPEWADLTSDKTNLTGWLDRMVVRPSLQSTTWERVAALAVDAARMA